MQKVRTTVQYSGGFRGGAQGSPSPFGGIFAKDL